MARNGKWLIDIVGVIALIAALHVSLVPSAAADPPARDVLVTNTAANPVPVDVISTDNVLVWRTTVGGQEVPETVPVSLSPVLDVHQYRTIRLTGGNRCGLSSVTIMLTRVVGTERFAHIDLLTLAPCQPFSRSYDVPGTAVVVQAQSGGGTAVVDFLIDGHE